MTDTADPVAAYLAEVRDDPSLTDVSALLAAIERALELTGEWRKDAAGLGERAQKAADYGDHTQSALLGYRAQALTGAAERLERVITRELLGESRPRLRESSGE